MSINNHIRWSESAILGVNGNGMDRLHKVIKYFGVKFLRKTKRN